jgi:hypothetical protein
MTMSDKGSGSDIRGGSAFGRRGLRAWTNAGFYVVCLGANGADGANTRAGNDAVNGARPSRAARRRVPRAGVIR